jgi:hypothetical protein
MTTLPEVKVVSADKCWCISLPIPYFTTSHLASRRSPPRTQPRLSAAATRTRGGQACTFADPDDFGRFVAEHNWADPVGMAHLAGEVDWAWNGIWPLKDRP